jgi:4-aminobutyrate aminotransferase-like enzyme
MNSTSQNILERRASLLRSVRTYYDVPFHPVRGRGQWLYDVDGKRYLDAYNNVAHVGHCHPHVVETLCRQAQTLNTNTRYLFESVLEYAERLTAKMPKGLDACMFTCTGSEANDLAYRIAMASSGGTGVITCERAYHGNTTFLDSIDGSTLKSNRKPAPYWANVPAPRDEFVKDPNGAKKYAEHFKIAIDALRGRGHAPAAFYFDTYFCADGVYLPPEGFLKEAIGELKRTGVMIIADEVQGGLGRCGSHLWSVKRLGIEPDMVVLGKPMGNGHPIGAVVARKEMIDAFFGKDRYFNTFAGNNVSSAVGTAVIDVVEKENLQENARKIGALMKAGIEAMMPKYPIINAVRGEGFLLGIDLVENRQTLAPAGKQTRWIINEMCRRGVLIGLTGPNRQARNVIKIRPPMVFDKEALDILLSTLDQVFAALPEKFD